MFTNKDDERVGEISNSSNTISKDTSIEGNVQTSGNLRVEGKILGNIRAKSKVVLGSSAKVEGKIFAQNADIEGTVKGTVQVEGLLTLKSNANIKGDIHTGKLVMEAGAQFDGKCKMGAFKNPTDLSTPAPEKQPKEQVHKPTAEKAPDKVVKPTTLSNS